jgi:hypothetical protein
MALTLRVESSPASTGPNELSVRLDGPERELDDV